MPWTSIKDLVRIFFEKVSFTAGGLLQVAASVIPGTGWADSGLAKEAGGNLANVAARLLNGADSVAALVAALVARIPGAPLVIMNAVSMATNQTSAVVDLRGRSDWSIQYHADADGTHEGILAVYLCNDQGHWPTMSEVLDPVPTAESGVLFSDGITIETGGADAGRVQWVGGGTGNLTLTSQVR